jgi:homoserine trans-succinylase
MRKLGNKDYIQPTLYHRITKCIFVMGHIESPKYCLSPVYVRDECLREQCPANALCKQVNLADSGSDWMKTFKFGLKYHYLS